MADERSAGGKASGGGPPADDSIARLLRLAGPRPPVPPDVRDRVHRAVREEWRREVRRQRARRWGFRIVPAALAASVLVAVILGGRVPFGEDAPVATVSLVSGGTGTLAPGDAVHRGDSLATGNGGVALTFGNGLSLRLAADTTAIVEEADEVTLVAGRLYADTGPATGADRSLTVHTELGSARDRGTQFAVGYAAGAMTVAVREGSVAVDAHDTSYSAEAGEKLTLEPDAEPRYEELPPHDPAWDWAAALAPPFDIERRPLIEFLQWAARETGRELVFASDAARVAAMVNRLSGTVEGLTPAEAIEAVRPTIPSFVLGMDDRRLVVSLSE
jgi:ferric-dicitrate binding protein FerR (iron transport regulator)